MSQPDLSLFSPEVLSVSRTLGCEAVIVIAVAAGVSERKDAPAISFACEIDPELCSDIVRELQKAAPGIAGKKNIISKPARATDKIPMTRQWKLPLADVEYARRWSFSDQEIRTMAIDFRDYWMERGDKRNWSLTWQNRIRKEALRYGKAPPSDEPPAVTELPLSVTAPKDLEFWRKAVSAFNERGFWPSANGPEPGQPGCRVPAEILAEFRSAA